MGLHCSICHKETALLTGNSVLTCVSFYVSFSWDEHESSVTAQEDLGQNQIRQIWYTRGVYFIMLGLMLFKTVCGCDSLNMYMALIISSFRPWLFPQWLMHTRRSNPWQYGHHILPILVPSGRELLLLYHHFSEAQRFSLWVGVQMFTKRFRPNLRWVETFKAFILNLHTVFTV